MSEAKANDVKAILAGKARGCPFHTQKAAAAAVNWWPDQINLKPLGKSPPPAAPGAARSYAEEFLSLDLDALKADVMAVMTKSQDWWPADYGHYGPFFVRMTWHSAGTYRNTDGRGGGGTGNLRFAPLNSWPDNGNLDKARRLLWPIKKKYGRKLSWGDLMIFAGNCAIESMGLQPFGFGGGREDVWEPEEDIYWGGETEWLAADRGGLGDKLDKPLGAVQMGLIYVNPEGPGGNPDPLQSAQDIRTTFGRMAMNDEETVALIAGGHTFGKAHGAADPGAHVGPEPEGAALHEQGFGWKNSFGTGRGADTITSGLEGAWTAKPTTWDNGYFDNLFGYEWELTKSPAGAQQWVPTDKSAANLVPDAHIAGKTHAPVMFTTDLALKLDPIYGPISKRFHENPEQFADAFKRAWYKLTHRDMGPACRCLGSMAAPPQIWQDPVPAGSALTDAQVDELKRAIMACPVGTTAPNKLVKAAWASASTYRCTDHRGGANGGRVALAPQKNWAANDPDELGEVLHALRGVQVAFSGTVSLADLIVLGGNAAIEAAAKAAGTDVTVPFTSGRGDATDEMTDAASFAVLEPAADGFRNYEGPAGPQSPKSRGARAEALLVDRSHMLKLSKSEMTVLIGGMRALNANSGGSQLGVFTTRPGQLTNDFFVNLLDMGVQWSPAGGGDDPDAMEYEGKDRASGEVKWRASRVDLVFGSNSQLRAIAEYYACDDSQGAFVTDFANAWAKVMNNDRYDLQ